MVLLKNSGVLPLKPGAKIAVVGPGGVTQTGMVGPYFGDDICYRPEESLKNRVYDCIPTIASQIAATNAFVHKLPSPVACDVWAYFERLLVITCTVVAQPPSRRVSACKYTSNPPVACGF